MPSSYSPYAVTKLCGNVIIGGSFWVTIGNVLPVLIGKGSKPQIWLQALQSPQSKKFILLVDSSISLHPKVRVEESGKNIVVRLDGLLVLSLRQTADDEITVNKIDLRPIGLNFFGDESGLYAGNMSFRSSTFRNVGTIMAFGEI
ncbi:MULTISPECIES: hypothetical protein [unclassified Pseudomonas]|uniref:hypothetical protein n=1 Tax=unclassified Pseudomonas TaxID=196821 RepID=UPI00224B264C|nr:MULTISPECIES: hypothetical protein [unclassified Pseudomonas]MCX2817441.1 hypothetical protein [Pseudomonas sp. DCB_E]MCX9145089.1 hypothetical protein [Pseudomonas sp. DCB_Q]